MKTKHRVKQYTNRELSQMPLWKLASIALGDLEALEKSPGFQIDMDDDFASQRGEKCCVCLAGSVLVRRCGRTEVPVHKAPLWAFAVDALRNGWVDYALIYLHRDSVPGRKLSRRMPSYHKSPEEFKAAFRRLIADLKEAGL